MTVSPTDCFVAVLETLLISTSKRCPVKGRFGDIWGDFFPAEGEAVVDVVAVAWDGAFKRFVGGPSSWNRVEVRVVRESFGP